MHQSVGCQKAPIATELHPETTRRGVKLSLIMLECLISCGTTLLMLSTLLTKQPMTSAQHKKETAALCTTVGQPTECPMRTYGPHGHPMPHDQLVATAEPDAYHSAKDNSAEVLIAAMGAHQTSSRTLWHTVALPVNIPTQLSKTQPLKSTTAVQQQDGIM